VGDERRREPIVVKAQVLALLVVGAFIVVQAWLHALRRKQRVLGRVTRMVRRAFLTHSVLWVPEVTFTTAEGRDHTFVASGRRIGHSWTPGQEVGVAYDAREPDSAVIATPFHMYLTPAFLSVALGVIAYWLLK
jgi:hypothetical protein